VTAGRPCIVRCVRVATLVALALTIAALLGCSPTKTDVAAEQKATCFANQKQALMAINVVHADAGIYPDIADVTTKMGLKCPAGGTYTFDPATDLVTCSVHGTRPNAPSQ
jgi:NaMN:DMB phosphoribosyltransferase